MKFLSAARYSIGERDLPFATGILYRWRICSVRYAAVDKGRNEPVKEGRGKIKRKKKGKEKGENGKKKNREIKENNYLFL
jgi:hypothetical protein